MTLRQQLLRQVIPMPINYVDDPAVAEHRWPFLMGVELELEDVAPAMGAVEVKTPRGWKVENEPSLRNGMEFVFSKPHSGDGVDNMLKSFYNAPLLYSGGPRTSTHVHVNARDLTIGQTQLIMAMSYVVETALFAAIKAPRKWCGYCMPLSEMTPTRLRRVFTAGNAMEFLAACQQKVKPDRYYGININSLMTHGSLEFRYFPGAPSKEQLTEWMTYVVELRKMANNVSIEELFNIDNPQQLAEFIARQLPTWGPALLGAMPIDVMYEKLHDLMCLLDEAVPDNNPRRDPLLFISPTLIEVAAKIISKKYGDEAVGALVKEHLQQLRVLSTKEWQLLMYDPMRQDLAKPKPKKAFEHHAWEEMYRNGVNAAIDAEPIPAVQFFKYANEQAQEERDALAVGRDPDQQQDPVQQAMDAYEKMKRDAELADRLRAAKADAANFAARYGADKPLQRKPPKFAVDLVGIAGQRFKPFPR